MLFGRIIEEAGFRKEDFPKLSQKELELFSRKGEKLEDLNLFEEMFAKNKNSKKLFEYFLKKQEEKNNLPASFQGKFSADSLIIYLPEQIPEIFLRF